MAQNQRPIWVSSDLTICFQEGTKPSVSDGLLAAFSNHGAVLKDGAVYVPSPVTEYPLPPSFVVQAVAGGARFIGPMGKYLNEAPKRIAAAAKQYDAAHRNIGGFAYQF